MLAVLTLSCGGSTVELGRAISTSFATRFGRAPHLVIVHLRRTKLDANREVVEGAQGRAPATARAGTPRRSQACRSNATSRAFATQPPAARRSRMCSCARSRRSRRRIWGWCSNQYVGRPFRGAGLARLKPRPTCYLPAAWPSFLESDPATQPRGSFMMSCAPPKDPIPPSPTSCPSFCNTARTSAPIGASRMTRRPDM